MVQQIKPGQFVQLEYNGRLLEGLVMPRSLYEDEKHITLKLKNGYNIGLDSGKVRLVKVVEYETPAQPIEEKSYNEIGNGPRVLIMGTGGTIASKVDYRTGAVKPAFSAKEIVDMVPEIGNIASISIKTIMNELSENMKPENWSVMSNEVYKAFNSGYRGIVIAHGTDTMHYSASAVSFAIENPPGPVVFVGSQRSSDRPSSDSAINLQGAVTFAAKSNSSGVFVAMHAGLDDNLVAVHRGTRVRKNHTSRRDAFESVNDRPFAYIDIEKGTVKQENETTPQGKIKLMPNFLAKASIFKFHPGISESLANAVFGGDLLSIIIEGTGLGHVSREVFPHIRSAITEGKFVGMTSQCIWGSVGMTVYETGRDLMAMGVVPLGDMLSETALVKSMWALGNGLDLGSVMPLNLRGEIATRRPVEK
ncbi:MAG: Glu-tRNA(Gln) amidotransferase subunit GatD [Nitrososphaerota archaeon]|nr:Glu-tRNA(Gln) amidotransferase subunit GatD [Nitrososphaerota archaeon]MDG6930650.1 Glu-tRNA(Gln) amidotransferase subunit GatD [Nitrososphaerota archaeon]